MPRPAFHRLPPERQEEILDAAAEVFAAHGYEAASYNALLGALGLTKGSAYHAFDGKADLYGAVLERELRRLSEQVRPPLHAQTKITYWRAVRGWLEETARYMAGRPQLAALLQGYAAARQGGALAAVDARLAEALGGPLLALVRAGQKVSAVRTDLPAELLAELSGRALETLDLHFLPRLPTLKPAAFNETIDVYVDLLRRLLAP